MIMTTVVYGVILLTLLAMMWGAYSKKADDIRTAFMDEVKYFPNTIRLEDGESIEQSMYVVNLNHGIKKNNMLVDVQTWMQNNREVNDYFLRTS